jgi:hypothetical protein
MKLFEVNITTSDGIFNDVVIDFSPEFESLRSKDKLDVIQDSLYELNKKFKEVNENY